MYASIPSITIELCETITLVGFGSGIWLHRKRLKSSPCLKAFCTRLSTTFGAKVGVWIGLTCAFLKGGMVVIS